MDKSYDLKNEVYFYNRRGSFFFGKGLTSGALGALLEQRGLTTRIQSLIRI